MSDHQPTAQSSAGPTPSTDVGNSLPRSQRVFISYRRSDCQPQANGLYDGLRHRLPSSSIFMDIDSIPPGVDFENHIRREIEVCDVVLVLVGDNWLDPRPGTGTRRIDESDDFVRLEIESALSAPRVRVVPVLVEGAQMPRAGELPESIRRLARINAIELSDSRWTADLERLAGVVENLGREDSSEQQTMRLADVDADVVAAAVASLPPTFRTKDLSENLQVVEAHEEVRNRTNYHTMMGRYLLKNHGALGLRQPEPAVDDRGAIWHKEPIQPLGPSPAPIPPPMYSGPPAVPAYTPARPPSVIRTTPVGWLMVALPALSCGLAAFVPAIWAATKRRHDLIFRRRMFTFAAAILVLLFGAFILIGTSPSDASGTATGAASDLGAALVVLCIVVSTVVAFIQRQPKGELPGTAQELARRAQREQYRDLIKRDAALACSILVGRPDVPRDYDDGGLLDLNALSHEPLTRFAPMSPEEARSIVEVRHRLGRLTSVEEVVAYARISEATAARLREIAVFL